MSILSCIASSPCVKQPSLDSRTLLLPGRLQHSRRISRAQCVKGRTWRRQRSRAEQSGRGRAYGAPPLCLLESTDTGLVSLSRARKATTWLETRRARGDGGPDAVSLPMRLSPPTPARTARTRQRRAHRRTPGVVPNLLLADFTLFLIVLRAIHSPCSSSRHARLL